MPRTFTLGTLVTRAQQRCDMENSSLIGTTEWKGIISSAWAELYAMIAESGMRYFETTSTINTTGVANYALPTDHLSTIGLDYLPSGTTGVRYEVPELMAQERNYYSGISGQWARGFAMVGANVILYPTPPAGQVYVLTYIPQPTELSASADATNVDVVTPDGEAFLLWNAAVVALAKEESDASLARAEREAARERVMSWATLRALHNGRRPIAQDVLGDRDPAEWRF